MVFYFVSNTCMSWFNFLSVVYGNLALTEKCSGPLRFRLRQVLLYIVIGVGLLGFGWGFEHWKSWGLRFYGGGCGVEGGTCPLCQGEQSATHILPNCQETQRLRGNFLDKKRLKMNMAVAFKKLVWSSKTTDLRELRIILYEIRCKLEHHAKQSGGGGGGRIIVVVVISWLIQVG